MSCHSELLLLLLHRKERFNLPTPENKRKQSFFSLLCLRIWNMRRRRHLIYSFFVYVIASITTREKEKNTLKNTETKRMTFEWNVTNSSFIRIVNIAIAFVWAEQMKQQSSNDHKQAIFNCVWPLKWESFTQIKMCKNRAQFKVLFLRKKEY